MTEDPQAELLMLSFQTPAPPTTRTSEDSDIAVCVRASFGGGNVGQFGHITTTVLASGVSLPVPL